MEPTRVGSDLSLHEAALKLDASTDKIHTKSSCKCTVDANLYEVYL